MRKRCLIVLATLILSFSLMGAGCGEEVVPKEKELQMLSPVAGNSLESTHEIESFKFVTTYDTGKYDLKRWRITDSKMINMEARVEIVPEGATVLIEHVHIDMSLKSTDPQLDGLSQDNMDDSFHGTSQDGFLVSHDYSYQNKFAIEGFSKDLIDGWMFVCGDYGSGSITQERLTEKNLVQDGDVYANKMQVVYDVLVKYAGEQFYHVVSVSDEFLIPVSEEYEKEAAEE